MSWYSAILHYGRSFADRYRIFDPAVIFFLLRTMTRSAHGPGSPKLPKSRPFQRTTGLHEEAAINRFMRHLVILAA
jgi:hypothetical protein